MKTETEEQPTLTENGLACMIAGQKRQQYCGRQDDHEADVEVIATCGDFAYYCDAALAYMLPQFAAGNVACSKCGTYTIYLAAVRPLR